MKNEKEEAAVRSRAASALASSVAIAIVIGATVAAFKLGQNRGLQSPGDNPGNLLMAVALVTLLVVVGYISSARRRWVAAKSMVLPVMAGLLVLVFHLFITYQGGYVDGMLRAASWIGREKMSLRKVSEALSDYRADRGTLPERLDDLTTAKQGPGEGRKPGAPYLPEIPKSLFPPHMPIRYQPDLENRNFLLWTAGPDRKWSMDPGAPLSKSLTESDKSNPGMTSESLKYPEFLYKVTYDPTNGTSSGDIIRVGM